MLTTIFLALLFLAVGLALILKTIVRARGRALEFPRYRAPVTAGRRLLPVLLGVIIAACGAGMLVLSQIG